MRGFAIRFLGIAWHLLTLGILSIMESNDLRAGQLKPKSASLGQGALRQRAVGGIEARNSVVKSAHKAVLVDFAFPVLDKTAVYKAFFPRK